MKLKPRPRYLDLLLAAQGNGMIKVVTGMRRCGKSTLLELFAQHLLETGTPTDHILQYKLESYEFAGYSADQLHNSILERMPKAGHWYLLIDEVQLIDGWERVINAIRVDHDADIIVTGSNAHLLSGQLATLLSGRAMAIRMYPLSFREFMDYTGITDRTEAFERYIRYGGLPPVVDQGANQALASTVLSGIYDTVLVRDVATHLQIRNPMALNDVARYLASTSGSPVSITNIENRLKSAHRPTSSLTIERYIQGLLDAYLFHRAQRRDLRGGQILQGLSKYYPADPGIRNMLLGFSDSDYGFALENLVHNELLAAGFHVTVGRTDRTEIDFIAERIQPDMSKRTLYVQVSASLMDTATREREMKPFRSLPAQEGERIIITLDTIGLGRTEEGVDVVNALDWLTTQAYR